MERRTSGPGLEAGVFEKAGEAEKDPKPGIGRGGGGDARRKKRTPYQQESRRMRQCQRR
jgi:hypothetical protein